MATPALESPVIATAARGQIAALTGIRALAAWWVVLFHLVPVILTLIPASRHFVWLVEQGDKGVDLFFILSGFVIAYNYSGWFAGRFSPKTYVQFLWLRLGRMYPVHIFSLGIWVVYVGANHSLRLTSLIPANFTLKAFLSNILLTHAWQIPLRTTWNYPAWSISLEWLAYLLFPAFALALARLARPATALAIVCALGIGSPFLHQAPWFHFVRILSGFALGCLLHWLYSRGIGRRSRWDRVAVVTIPGVVFLAAGLREFVLPWFVVLIYSLTGETGLAARLLGSRPFEYWGRVSYSLYMMHAPGISAVRAVFGPKQAAIPSDHSTLAGLLLLCGYLVAIGLAASLTYRFIEEPARRMMRGTVGGRVTRPA